MIGPVAKGWRSIRYRFSPDRLATAQDQEMAATASRGVELLRVNCEQDILTMFPINTLPDKDDFLEPRYAPLVSISLEGFNFTPPDSPEEVFYMLEELPPGFLKDPEYGLGLQNDFRSIIHAIRHVKGVTKLLITKKQPSSISDPTYVLSYREFDATRRGIARIHRHALTEANDEKHILVHNALLAARSSSRYPPKYKTYKPNTIFRVVHANPHEAPKVSVGDQRAALAIVSKNGRDLVEAHPQELLELRREIELVTLEQLIKKLETMLAGRRAESDWQKLFFENPFILSLAFGLPILASDGQVSVGGRKFDGSGGKIADFLCANALTDNVALLEIKTPKAKLLSTEYRGGVFGPSSELTGSVAQALDQRYQLQKSIASLKESSRRYDLETYAVKCVLIIGTTPPADKPDQRKSFELFRNSLHDVVIITFDELIEKLKHLHAFLCPRPSTNAPGGISG